MKIIQWIVGALLLVTGIACTEDKGNYDYTPLNKLTIRGMKEAYTVEVDSVFTLPEVTVTGEKDFREDDYEYYWYMWRNTDPQTMDTLSRQKDLKVRISFPVGEYTLRYVIKEKRTDVFYWAQASLGIVDLYSKGLLALSRVEDEDSDVTFINIANTVTKHAYKKANGVSAGHHPKGIFYIGGKRGMKNVVVISTEEKAMTVEPIGLTDYRSLSKWFYIEPEGVMECCCTDGFDEFLIIDGKAYPRSVHPFANPSGMISPKIKGDYDLAPFSLCSDDVFFYDRKKKCFFFYPGWGAMLVPEAVGSAFNAADMQMDMLYGTAIGKNLRAVMADANGTRYMISGQQTAEYVVGSGYQPKINALRKLELNQQGAAEATCFAISSTKENFLYYAYCNKIVCVSMINSIVLDEYTLPQPIDYMEFDHQEHPDRLYVAVSDGSANTDSGSIYYLRLGADGSLEQIEGCIFKNVCGKVVDFEFKP